MAISITLNEYISFGSINHNIPHTYTSFSTSFPPKQSLHLPTDQIAKVIILQNNAGQYILATLPSNSPILINEINKTLNMECHLVDEWLLDDLSPAYNKNSMPTIGTAYKMKIFIDKALLVAEKIFITADDSRYLVKIDEQLYHNMAALMPLTKICGSAIGQPQFVENISNN